MISGIEKEGNFIIPKKMFSWKLLEEQLVKVCYTQPTLDQGNYKILLGSRFGIEDSGFRIQDWKIKVWKCISRKKFQILEYSPVVSTIVLL